MTPASTLTVTEACQIAKVGRGVICRLAKEGKLPTLTRTAKQGHFKIVATPEQILKAVAQDRPRGWQKPDALPAAKGQPQTLPPAQMPGGLSAVLKLAAIPEEKRTVLLKLAEKYTAEELELIAQL